MRDGAGHSRRFALNGTSIFGGEALARVRTMLMALVVARFFGPEALGKYGYSLALASVLAMVPDFGLHLFTVRELSSSPERAREVFWVVHRLKAVLMAGVLVLAAGLMAWGPGGQAGGLLLWILIARSLVETLSQASMAVFRAFERMHYIAFQQLVNSSVVLIYVAVALAVEARLSLVVGGLIVGQLAETGLGWVFLNRAGLIVGSPMWNPGAMAPVIAACLPIGLTAILVALNLRFDILVLGRYVGSRQLGEFSAASWFVTAAFLAASLLMSLLFPKLSRVLSGPPKRRGPYVSSLLKNAVMLGAAGALAVWLLAPALIAHGLGRDFSRAVETLRILAPALPLVFLNTILFHVFVAARRQASCLAILATGLASGACVSIWLTSRYGVAGCALAQAARELVMTAAYFGFLVRGNHGSQVRRAGLALTKVFAGASVCLCLGVLLTASVRPESMWLAAWVVMVLAGALVTLGWPSLADWRLLTDDRI